MKIVDNFAVKEFNYTDLCFENNKYHKFRIDSIDTFDMQWKYLYRIFGS